MWPSKTKKMTQSDREPSGERIHRFIESDYLTREFIVPTPVAERLAAAATVLSETPGFVGLVNVGGTANGSYELRKLSTQKPASDLDFYFIGRNDMLDHLTSSSRIVEETMQGSGLGLDGVLNGRNPASFLNLDRLDEIVQRGDTNLLALPFQSFFGNTHEAKKAVLDYVGAQANQQELWDEIASYHLQSLSLHHGSIPETLMNEINETYYPAKVARFDLPLTVSEARLALE